MVTHPTRWPLSPITDNHFGFNYHNKSRQKTVRRTGIFNSRTRSLCYAQIYPRRVASSPLPTTPCPLCTPTTQCLALTQPTTHLLHTHSKPKQVEAERKHLHHPQHPYRIPHNCLSCPRVRHPGQQLRFCNGLTGLCGPHRFGLPCPFLHPLTLSELGLPYSLKG